ncbi:hypothetical protein WJX72_006939 [[Myrmecia] bisecta]|uniref:Uncharacterized protein n=1 Tax=[Myrmecia] bisecta TaxID=41462 RepID=A0AAW1Q1C9_9CHLO
MDPEQVAYHVVGSSEAAAIVVSGVFFVFMVLAVVNLKVTKFRYYVVVVIAASFRVVGFAARAAYLSHYRPALAGDYLAFTNAGFGANLAVLCLVLLTWCKHADMQVFRPLERQLYPWISGLLILPILAFGPVCGIIAAGLIYGAITPGALASGERLRRAASWGLLCVLIVFSTLITRVTARVLLYKAAAASDSKHGREQPQTMQRMRLVAVLFTCTVLLDLRACIAVAALYHPRFVADEHLYYPLIVLPELLVLFILTVPTLMAQVALVYPPDPQEGRSRRTKGDADRAEKGDELPS